LSFELKDEDCRAALAMTTVSKRRLPQSRAALKIKNKKSKSKIEEALRADVQTDTSTSVGMTVLYCAWSSF
jgi:hypothetical protein